MIMPVPYARIQSRRRNYCQQCRMAAFCIPASIDKKKQKDPLFQFMSRTLKPGESLTHQGEHHEHLFALRQGALKSITTKHNGDEFIMQFHLAPDIFGWEATDPEQKSFQIQALEHSNVCIVPLKKLSEIATAFPEFQQSMLTLIHPRLRRQNEVALRTSAEQRVASFLFDLSKHYAKTGLTHLSCHLPMSRQELANYLRLTPETISRTFKALEKKQIIKVSRNKVQLRNISQLTLLAEAGPEREDASV